MRSTRAAIERRAPVANVAQAMGMVEDARDVVVRDDREARLPQPRREGAPMKVRVQYCVQ
jgi:hypothetical protein